MSSKFTNSASVIAAEAATSAISAEIRLDSTFLLALVEDFRLRLGVTGGGVGAGNGGGGRG